VTSGGHIREAEQPREQEDGNEQEVGGASEVLKAIHGWLNSVLICAHYPPLLAAGTGLVGARLWRRRAGRRGGAAFGCGKDGVGCRRPANHAKWAAARESFADINGVKEGGVREDGELPQTSAAISAIKNGALGRARAVVDMIDLIKWR